MVAEVATRFSLGRIVVAAILVVTGYGFFFRGRCVRQRFITNGIVILREETFDDNGCIPVIEIVDTASKRIRLNETDPVTYIAPGMPDKAGVSLSNGKHSRKRSRVVADTEE